MGKLVNTWLVMFFCFLFFFWSLASLNQINSNRVLGIQYLAATGDNSGGSGGDSTYTSPTPDPNDTTVIIPTETPYPTTTSSTSGSNDDSSTTTYTPTTTPYPTFTTSTGDTTTSADNTTVTTSTQTTDRLAQVDSATLSCIKTKLTSQEFDTLRYLVPKTTAEEDLLKSLKERVVVCFESYDEAVKTSEASDKISEIEPDVKECLVSVLGQRVFEEISTGARQPTEDEKRKGNTCYAEDESKIVYQTKTQELSSDVESCIKLAVGDDRYNLIKSGKSTPTLEERERSERCFGASTNLLQKRPVYRISSDIENCIKDKIGGERFTDISLGKDEPDNSEKKLTNACFGDINETQTRFLPVPPAQIPFVETSSSVAVELFSENIEDIGGGVKDRKLVFKGKGPVGSLVDIYIFSEPIVVTTKVDENGEWVYEFSQPLDGEKHIAYAAVKTNDGRVIRSSVFDFQVQAASMQDQQFLNEQNASDTPNRFVTYGLFAVGIISTLVAAGYIYLTFVKESRESVLAQTKSSNGESKDETASSPKN